MLSSGCALCYTPYDYQYSAFGGVQEREDRVQGRVGSILSDPMWQSGEMPGLSEEPAESDLYRLESEAPDLEIIEPQPTPAEPGTLAQPGTLAEPGT